MRCSRQGLELIKRFEGFSARPYLCPAGKLTIGYGHVIRPAEKFSDNGITEEAATALLVRDISLWEETINRLVTVTINQNQFDALVSFIHNIGARAFEKSTLLRRLNQGAMQRAAAEFSRWTYSNGCKLEGLVRRRAAESTLFSQYS
jgi:lysozyme